MSIDARQKAEEKNSENARYRERLIRLVDMNQNRKEGVFQRYEQINVSNRRALMKVWNKAINAGSITEVLLARMQTYLLVLKKELGFSYVRMVNVFSWDMHIREDRGSRELNFEMMDNVLDFLVDNGMKPILDFGDKPKRVFRDTGDVIHLETKRPVFQNLSECRWLVENFMRHVIQRYGVSEVESWIFDLWNDHRAEKDSGFTYLKTFDVICHIVRSYVPAAQVGGCCMELGRDPGALLTQWFKEHFAPDFISLAAFPYKREVPGFYMQEGDAGRRKNPLRKKYVNCICTEIERKD